MASALVGAILAAGLINKHEAGEQRKAQQHLMQSVQEMTEGFSRFLPLVAPPGARTAPLLPLERPDGPLATTAAAEALSKTVEVTKGDTLMGLLTDAGVAVGEAHDAISALRKLFDPRRLQLGQEITLTFSRAADTLQLSSMNLAPSAERTVAVQRQDSGAFKAQATALPLKLEMAHTGGVIDSSLFATGQKLGIPASVMVEMIHLFSYDVDFQRDVQPGDNFDVYFQRYTTPDGRIAKDGAVVYASMTIGGQPMRFYRYESKDGDVDYYSPSGRSIRRALLRTPLDGARITSSFGMRKHPILGYSKMHKGVDFGAPTGTPIQAAGDGTIDVIGWEHGYGKYIRIRHTSEYSTAYAHMSAFANLRRGQHVRQGQVIGYVGMTGRATGPHLHYEVLVHNKQVNPLSVRLPTGKTLDGNDLLRFRQEVRTLDQKMAQAPMQTLVAQADK